MSSAQAQLRRFMVAYFIVNAVFLLPLLLLFGERQGGAGLALPIFGIATGLLAVWIVFDFSRTYMLARKAGVVGRDLEEQTQEAARVIVAKGLREGIQTVRAQMKKEAAANTPTFLWLFFVQGVTLDYLRSLIQAEDERIGRAALAWQEQQRIIETRAREAEVEETVRREERRRLADDLLITEGVSLGIQEPAMRSCLAERGQEEARAVIVRKKREQELRARALKYACWGTVEQLLQSGEFDEAETVIVKAKVLIEEGMRFGVEERVRSYVFAGRQDAAEEVVAAAKQNREFLKLKDDLELRIGKLPPPAQVRPRELFEQLARTRYGTREFRKALHELERTLDTLEK